MYSSYGCPYKCAFCSSPAHYKEFSKQWILLKVNDIVNHVEYVVDQYSADYIYFIDDDSFVNLNHVESIIDEINRRNIDVGLGFRGARINEIKKMSHSFLNKLASAGTDIMHIGAESGSNRILKLIRKDCTVKDIVECNRKLAYHPNITAAYNFIIGVPTETLDELNATRNLMLRLVDDNPNCIIFQPNKYRPLPGTELFELAVKNWNYSPPKTLDEWIDIEAEGDTKASWYSKGMKNLSNMMLVTSYFIDNKIVKVSSGRTLFYKVLLAINYIYKPIAKIRLKRGFSHWLIEYRLYRLILRLLP